MKIQFTSQLFREGKMFVAYSPDLDVFSCATTETKAQKNLLEAVAAEEYCKSQWEKYLATDFSRIANNSTP